MKINLFDLNGVNRSPVSGYAFPSKHVEWAVTENEFDGITLFTDKCIMQNKAVTAKSKIKIAWLVEPKVVYGVIYKTIKNKEKQFDYILTHDVELLKRSDKYIFVPVGGTWIPINKQKIYPKTKNTSSVVSKKNMFPGHKIRYKMCDIINDIDYYGSKFKWIATKDIGIRDYMFSVAIENSSVPNYFTEKIIDCFLCGAVPVYWGCTNLGKFFNMDGVITFKDANHLKEIRKTFTAKKYEEMMPAIKDNFERAKKYMIIIDWMYDNILKDFKI